ncbi:MAG: endo-1,4-beta-xylanase [Treponema sp.]|jgi:GH35 family endo-1,4-beta-xylanase|nr:endo-1,4-beta-xylanase [Treponema sp.]
MQPPPPRYAALFMDNIDPYFREDPGPGLQRITVHKFDIEKDMSVWKPWRTNDGRILPNSDSNFTSIESPFGSGNLIMLTTYFDPEVTKRHFGGYGMRSPIDPALAINSQTFIEFDFYYTRSAAGKYMKFEIWSTSAGGEGIQTNSGAEGTNKTPIYIRTENLEGAYTYNLDFRCGYFSEETWFNKSVKAQVPVPTGTWEYLNIDLLTETDAKVSGGLLMIGNIRITQMDPDGALIPDVVNSKSFSEVAPVKEKYNPDNEYFLVGAGLREAITPNSIGSRHYGLFVSHRNLKPEIHLRAPKWLKDEYPGFTFHPEDEGPEWNLPADYYLGIMNSGKLGEYKLHGHCLAWQKQSPGWMKQIIPQNVTSVQWNSSGSFYTADSGDNGPFQKISKETMRRIYFNHVMYEMRHFMSVDTRYNSGKERGIIPFHSFDVVNTEIHESWHSFIIQKNKNEWKTALRHASWLMAMTDNDINNIRQHYMYLIFRYAHIAVPNAQMAEKYKANYNDPYIVPAYMKMDNHDNNGSIDAYISEKPPLLSYNDYEITVYSKARVICNMIRELNTMWKTDRLYDGRNLIECMGIQGHDTVSPTLTARHQQSAAMFTNLIDEGLLDKICYSEVDIKLPDSAPGGKALAPDVLNQKQADVIGYQYALLFKMFEKNKKYIDHVIIWNQFGAGWQNSYVLFDHEQKASQAYYAVMDPDKFIKGHSYLDNYFFS